MLRQPQVMHSECRESSQNLWMETENTEVSEVNASRKGMTLTFQESTREFREDSQNSRKHPEVTEIHKYDAPRECTTLTFQESTREFGEDSQKSQIQNNVAKDDFQQNIRNGTEKCEVPEHSWDSTNQQWCDINEVIESDFLISPGDIYPNRKVELEDADIKEGTRAAFEVLCKEQHEAFLKDNKDIG